MIYSDPYAYFITFTTRGSRLHGCVKGSVNRKGEYIGINSNWEGFDKSEMKNPPIVLSTNQRQIVHDALKSHCEKNRLILHIVAVQSNHVHILISANNYTLDYVATALKAAATNALHKSGEFEKSVKIWTRKASKRYVFNDEEYLNVYDYIRNQ